MPDTPDLDKVARNYLDLWQEHLNAISRDGETMDVLARTVALMNSGAAAFASAAEGYTSDDKNARHKKNTSAEATSSAVAGSETTGAAHESASLNLAQCLERITTLEKRVTDLEAAKRKPAKRPSSQKR